MAWKEIKSALAPGNYYDSLIRDVGSRVKKIFVPEMKRGQIVGEIMKYTCCDIIPYNQTDGEIIHPSKHNQGRMVYGMTGGQVSPATPLGIFTSTTVEGKRERPFDPKLYI